MTRRTLVLMLAVLSLSAPAVARDGDADERAARRFADEVARAVVAGDLDRVLAGLHYPPEASDELRDRDRRLVEGSLRQLRAQFGNVARLRHAPDPAGFFEASAGAGDRAYWRDLAPAHASEHVYFGRFRGYGPGFVIVRVVSLVPGGEPALQRVGFGLPMPNASRERVAAMTGALLAADR